ncbi:MAG TPA: hypothetical protein VLV83_27255 [Acidobacteriota bacterium]|nr:hypothetical protein [Acidobacteriota bacterium]
MESIETEVMEDPSKRDTRGRRIVKTQERERLIEEYKSSGLTQKAFCRREAINLHTFVTWLSKHRGKNGKQGRGTRTTFREVQLPAVARKAGVMEVQLPGGEIVRGADPETLAKLVGLLRG